MAQLLNRFANKIIVVTGGTGNVGSGIVKGFLKHGATVIVPSRNEESLQSLKKFVHPHEEKLVTICESVGTDEGIAKFKNVVEEKFGRVDHLVSSIGAAWFKGPLSQQSTSEFNKVIGDLATSHFILGKAFLPWMSKQEGSTYTIITGAAGEGLSDPKGSLMTVGAATLFGISMAFRREFEHDPLLVNEYRIAVRVVKPEDVKQSWENSNEVFANEFLRSLNEVIEKKTRSQVIRLASLPK